MLAQMMGGIAPAAPSATVTTGGFAFNATTPAPAPAGGVAMPPNPFS